MTESAAILLESFACNVRRPGISLRLRVLCGMPNLDKCPRDRFLHSTSGRLLWLLQQYRTIDVVTIVGVEILAIVP